MPTRTKKPKPTTTLDHARLAVQSNGEASSSEECAAVGIELPAGVCFSGFATPRLDCTLTRRQAAAAKMLWCSAAEEGVRHEGGYGNHPDGSAVQSIGGGVRYMLDRYADAFEAETGRNLLTDFDLCFR